MARQGIEYRFKVEAYSPETIPMSRLAEYMSDLATLLGNRDRVHFSRLEPGSTTIVHLVELEADPKVRERITCVRLRTAPEDAIEAYSRINKKLRDDNGRGFVEGPEGIDGLKKKIIEFPGKDRTESDKFDSISQPGSLDGMLIRIGGRDETVPIYLEEGDEIHRCNANRAMAKRLARFLYDVVRVRGVGKWNRDDFGNWVMEEFRINDFEKLDALPLREAVVNLRNIKSDIQNMDDPIAELNKLRHGPKE